MLLSSGADPLAMAGPGGGQGPSGGLPPHLAPALAMGAGHPLLLAAREQERMYLELLNRPPYNTDPIMAQQVSYSLLENFHLVSKAPFSPEYILYVIVW